MAKAPNKLPMTRRYPRFVLDVDWFVETDGCSTLGRGLEVSVRGVKLPVACASPFAGEITLFIALPHRQEMFKARCRAQHHGTRGWTLGFTEVSPEDLQLLGHCLLCEFGVAALPDLEARRPLEVDLSRNASRPYGG